MPTTVVIKNDEEMDQTEYMSTMENISGELEKVDGVDTVRSLTRPTGEKLDRYVTGWMKQILNSPHHHHKLPKQKTGLVP